MYLPTGALVSLLYLLAPAHKTGYLRVAACHATAFPAILRVFVLLS
jgi:hypothetical protein